MKVSKEQVAHHQKQSWPQPRGFSAARLCDVTVAEIMKEADLTHGAFYGYFRSKEALIAEAIGEALPPPPDKAKPRRPAADFRRRLP